MNKITIYFVCDAGMGSSALGASLLRKHIKTNAIIVKNCAINDIKDDCDVIITHQGLVNHIVDRKKYVKIYTIDHFLNDQRLENIVKEIRELMNETIILSKDAILLNCKADTSDDAIKAMGNLLLVNGYIDEPYIGGMIKRDHELTTYIGNDIAIPHGEYEVRQYVKSTGLAVMIYPEGIAWGGGNVRIVIGIAANGDDHMAILSNIALKLSDMDVVEKIVSAQDVDYIYDVLTKED